jgi:cyclopropane fatty-acyl-phospholipid synthase-like methyltransferase
MEENDYIWDARFSSEDYVYGTAPNEWLKEVLLGLKPGDLLLPCEGEGRNAVFAASRGWNVTAFDLSEVGRKKALELAEKKGVEIKYTISDISEFSDGTYDTVAMIFTHFPSHLKKTYLSAMIDLIKPGGSFIMEVFSKNQLEYQKTHSSGGPGTPDLLYSKMELKRMLDNLDLSVLEEKEVLLREGLGHAGVASVIRVHGIKK